LEDLPQDIEHSSNQDVIQAWNPSLQQNHHELKGPPCPQKNINPGMKVLHIALDHKKDNNKDNKHSQLFYLVAKLPRLQTS